MQPKRMNGCCENTNTRMLTIRSFASIDWYMKQIVINGFCGCCESSNSPQLKPTSLRCAYQQPVPSCFPKRIKSSLQHVRKPQRSFWRNTDPMGMRKRSQDGIFFLSRILLTDSERLFDIFSRTLFRNDFLCSWWKWMVRRTILETGLQSRHFCKAFDKTVSLSYDWKRYVVWKETGMLTTQVCYW